MAGRRVAPAARHWVTAGARLWVAVVALLVAGLTPVAWSYGHALAAPGNDPLSIRSVEWLRDHNFAWLVNDVENLWYSHHRPKKGGLPAGALRSSLRPRTRAGGGAGKQRPGPQLRAHLPAPAPVAPIVANPLPGEGQWSALGQSVGGLPAMYGALLRPDKVHTSLVTAVAWMDPKLVRAVGYAGVVEPGGGPWQNQAPIPVSVRPQLVATFNSGFKMRDARGGYYADGKTVRSLRTGAATLVIRPDGTPSVGQWGRDFQLGPDVAFARQNLALIVDGGQPAPDLQTDNPARWGATIGNRVLVWRSGLGVTADGALVYAAGNGLSALSLAGVLARAGAVRAMELDINSRWVDFFTYGPPAPGAAPADVTVTKLSPDMRPPLNDYLTASSRDFIALLRRF